MLKLGKCSPAPPPVRLRSKRQIPVRAALYDKCVQFAIDNLSKHHQLSSTRFEKYIGETRAADGKSVIKSYGYEAEKIRMFRAASIDGGMSMQVLNMSIFPRPEYDIPIFCADFFSTPARNIIVLDLNPLYDVALDVSYRDKYYAVLQPLVMKYRDMLPWGDKLTGESLKFFSPIVLWSKPENTEDVNCAIFSAFEDYLMAWIKINNASSSTKNSALISKNMEAQHRYLTWRATKDPGRPVLTRLLGEQQCEEYIREFLFNGLCELGTKSFTDYFPEYRCSDGSINTARSMMGKSYSKRPWDDQGKPL